MKTPKKGTVVLAPRTIKADPALGVGEVPAGTRGKVTHRPHDADRNHGYVEVTWDNGARFYTTKYEVAVP